MLCFFPEAHPRNLDIRQHADNKGVTTPTGSTSSSGLTPRACGRSTVYCCGQCSCFIGGCDPLSVINTPLSSAVLLCMCVRCVARLARAAKKRIRIFSNMVKLSRCPILDLKACVRASQSSCLGIIFYFFSQLFFIYCIMYA